MSSNMNAMVAAAQGKSGAPLDPSAAGRRPSKSTSAFRGPNLVGNYVAMGSSVPVDGSPFSPGSYGAGGNAEAAVTDGPPLATMQDNERGASKSRVRRASEGSRLKGEGKRASGSELKCEKCGKGYKHSSCLTKHLSVALSPPPSHILSQLMTNALPASLSRVLARPLFFEVLR
jgi:hypothetical protein